MIHQPEVSGMEREVLLLISPSKEVSRWRGVVADDPEAAGVSRVERKVKIKNISR